MILFVRGRRFAFSAQLTRDVDHLIGFMGVAPNSFFAALDAVHCEFVASDMFASRTPEVDHIRLFMFATTSLCAALGAVGCESIAPVVFAPCTRKVDHFVRFMFATMSPYAALEAAVCESLASDMFASLTHEVDHCRAFMFAAVSLCAALNAAVCESLASVMAAPRTRDIDESMRFAVHRATCRLLPFPAIIRLFLLWETFAAIIRHIVPKCLKYEIYAWPQVRVTIFSNFSDTIYVSRWRAACIYIRRSGKLHAQSQLLPYPARPGFLNNVRYRR